MANLKSRLIDHNDGCCDYARSFKPWKVVWCSAFETKEKARPLSSILKMDQV
ncbi:MAG: hypothetical protein ACPGGN_04940 [Opitutales bacterium]